MQVYLNEIVGYADAITATLMSKRSWTREKEQDVRNLVDRVTTRHGTIKKNADENDLERFSKMMKRTVNWGIQHITLLRFIDFSFTVEGLHRAGQDDWDAHAKRFDNRIIRTSTRLSEFGDEKSAWYEDKILSTDEALSVISIEIPDTIEKDGIKYVKCTNGYIREDMKDNFDVKRGLYMLSIPSNFIFKINLTELAHVYKERNINGGANPEVKQVAEAIADHIYDYCDFFTRRLLLDIKN